MIPEVKNRRTMAAEAMETLTGPRQTLRRGLLVTGVLCIVGLVGPAIAIPPVKQLEAIQ
jgi:hypothetical protein